jgi:hypothetical protein
MSRSSSWRRIVDELAKEFDGKVSITNGGHLAIKLPNNVVVYTAGTPKHPQRDKKNVLAGLRRAVKNGRVK